MYDLHQLGWFSFQQLVLTIAKEVFGQNAMSFLSSNDGGRDGSFSGDWAVNEKTSLSGKFVFQCKFTSQQNYNIKFADLKEELPKAEALVKSGLCDIYILITNAGISGKMSAKLETALRNLGVKHVVILGSSWLFQTIQENNRLRRLVPRIYGLGDLSQILDERVYLQGRTLLESLKDELAKVVITTAYQKAAEALDIYGFVLLVGEPAAGKTTIASLLAMGALDQWKASTLKLSTAEQVVKHWNPDDPSQFFWVDDCFGVTQYESNLVHKWNHNITHIKAMLKSGAKIVMTSRDYIYNRARNDLKEGAFPILNESQVVIDVHDLTITEKRQMLYNHLKMGTQPLDFKREIKPFLEYIASLPSFIPETARRIAAPFFTKNLYISEWHLAEFVKKQESFLVDVLSGLDRDSVAALALIFMNNDSLSSPINLKQHEVSAVDRIGSSLGGCTEALNSMKGNLVQFVFTNDDPIWKFKHPTVGDAFAIFVAKSPELIEIYLQGSVIEKLMEQVSCGDVGIEKAIVVPTSFFELILSRLKNFKTTKAYKSEHLSIWGAKRKLQEFLTSRCSGKFLTQYIAESPDTLVQVTNPGLYLDSVAEVGLAYRLHHFKLLPEENRKAFVAKVSQYAVEGQDLYALKSTKIREIFTDKEYQDLKNKVEKELIPNLNDLTEKYQNNFDKSEEPEDYMDHLKGIFKILETQFEDEEEIIDKIQGEIENVDEWISQNTFDKPEKKARERLADEAIKLNPNEQRSIFDDIDVF